MIACAAAAGLLCAPLRETAFILSPVMLMGYGLLLALSFPRRALPIALGTAAALGLSSHLSPELSAYGHVYGLFWEKLRHGLRLPADPALLSANARLLWMGPFQSPGAGFLIFAFLPLAAIIVPRLLGILFGEGERQPDRGAVPMPVVVDALLVFYFAGTALILRLTPFLAFLLCAAAVRLPRRWLRAAWLPAAFFLLAALEGAKTMAPSSPFNPILRLSAPWAGSESHPGVSYGDVVSLIRWLRAHGGKDRPVLANFGLSASLLTYASTPVLLQPKFEAPGIRAKTMDFLRALYSGEPEFLPSADATARPSSSTRPSTSSTRPPADRATSRAACGSSPTPRRCCSISTQKGSRASACSARARASASSPSLRRGRACRPGPRPRTRSTTWTGSPRPSRKTAVCASTWPVSTSAWQRLAASGSSPASWSAWDREKRPSPPTSRPPPPGPLTRRRAKRPRACGPPSRPPPPSPPR